MEETVKNSQSQAGPGAKKNIGMAVVAYIIFFIPLLTEAKNDPFVKYHVKQGLVLFICSFGVYLVGQVIPVLGFVVASLLNIVIIVLLIVGIINAANGDEKPLPLIGKFADNFKF